ncbi:hypothetical protein ACIQTN_25800 [Streptomyces werraensis]|uniref:hypothetical protein n=1 Tax=Streptomyces werraensis TaxID=68284 RepID=UPI00381B290C
MAAIAKLPLFMRVGEAGPMHEIGCLGLPVDGNGWLTFDRTLLADALRTAADALDDSSGEVPDAAAHG